MKIDANFTCSSCHKKFSWQTGERIGVCAKCQQDEILQNIDPKLLNFPKLKILDITVEDYKKPVINNDFALFKIEGNEFIWLEKIMKLCGIDKENKSNEYLKEGRFLLALKHHMKKHDDYPFSYSIQNIWESQRMWNHMYNKYNDFSGEFQTTVFNYSTEYTDWKQLFIPKENILNINLDELIHMSIGRIPDYTDTDIIFILDKLNDAERSGNLFRGINNFFSNFDGISTSNYRNNREYAESNMLQDHESFIVKGLIEKPDSIYPSKNSICAITDLRHSRIDTNVLDFSRDHKISLFFCCHGGDDDTGEILILHEKLEKLYDLTYPVKKDYELEPKAIVHKNRVNAQASVFIYCHKGFLSRVEYDGKLKSLLIDSTLKNFFISHSEHTVDDIYPDFYGFLENQENFNSPANIYKEGLRLLNIAVEGFDPAKGCHLTENDKRMQFQYAKDKFQQSLKKCPFDWDKKEVIENQIKLCDNKISESNKG